MNSTYENDLDRVKTNHAAEYLGQRSFRSKVILGAHTQRIDRITRTTKVVGKTICAFFSNLDVSDPRDGGATQEVGTSILGQGFSQDFWFRGDRPSLRSPLSLSFPLLPSLPSPPQSGTLSSPSGSERNPTDKRFLVNLDHTRNVSQCPT